MAGIGGTAVRCLAGSKGVSVAFAALFVHFGILAQGAAEGSQLFGEITEFAFLAVIDAHLNARQVVKVVQKLLHCYLGELLLSDVC